MFKLFLLYIARGTTWLRLGLVIPHREICLQLFRGPKWCWIMGCGKVAKCGLLFDCPSTVWLLSVAYWAFRIAYWCTAFFRAPRCEAVRVFGAALTVFQQMASVLNRESDGLFCIFQVHAVHRHRGHSWECVLSVLPSPASFSLPSNPRSADNIVLQVNKNVFNCIIMISVSQHGFSFKLLGFIQVLYSKSSWPSPFAVLSFQAGATRVNSQCD